MGGLTQTWHSAVVSHEKRLACTAVIGTLRRCRHISLIHRQRKQTPYHELGHYVEFFNKDALRISKEFIKARTKNENYIKLTDLFHGLGFSNKEIVKPDDFITPYIGKEYKEASEVLSMGLEVLYEPSEILKKIEVVDGKYQPIYAKIEDDMEFLYLIVGLILKA